MSGYDIYSLCRRFQKRNIPQVESYVNLQEYGYYELLHQWFVERGFQLKEMKEYITVIYNHSPESFDPYTIMEDKWEEVFSEWKKTRSTKALYFDTVKKSFIFITNFCIKNSITLDKYKKDYAIRHIREKKVDEAVAVYLKFFEKNKLNKVQKILLQDYLSKYNNIVVRIRDPELDNILASSSQEMKKVLEVCASNTKISNQSST